MTKLVTEVRGSVLTDVEAIIRACGGHPWDDALIGAYMRKEALRHQPNIWWHVQQIASTIEVMIVGCLGIFLALGCTAFAGTVMSMMANAFGLSPSWLAFATAQNAGTFLFCAVVCLGIWFACSVLFNFFFGRKVALGYATWKHVDIYLEQKTNRVHLTQPAYVLLQALESVPEEAKRLMAAVTQELPGASFQLSYLSRSKFLLDPVLWVMHDGERYQHVPAIVWDENGAIVSPPQ